MLVFTTFQILSLFLGVFFPAIIVGYGFIHDMRLFGHFGGKKIA
jgi:hypothetical protein